MWHLLAVQMLMGSLAQGENLIFSELSCQTLEPQPISTVLTSSASNISSSREVTIGFPSVRTSQAIRVTIITDNGPYYGINRPLQIHIQADDFYDGFMAQVTTRSSNRKSSKVLGYFEKDTAQAQLITCPKGDLQGNTITNYDKPVRLGNLTITWVPDLTVSSDISIWVSILYESDVIIQQKILKPNVLPPTSKFDCGQKANCFRACPYWMEMCSFQEAKIVAIFHNKSSEDMDFTLGMRTALLRNYVAFGVSHSDNPMTDIDVSVCYKTPDDKVGLGHYFIETLDKEILPHRDSLRLTSSYIDGDMIWCSFQRLLDPTVQTGIDLSGKVSMLMFTGHQHDGEVKLPTEEGIILVGDHEIIPMYNNFINDIEYVVGGESSIHPAWLTILLLANIMTWLHK